MAATVTPTIPAVLDPTMARKLRTARSAVERATVQRDETIRAALDSGASLREVAEVVGLSHTWVRKIGADRG